jgi:hypothetical protein
LRVSQVSFRVCVEDTLGERLLIIAVGPDVLACAEQGDERASGAHREDSFWYIERVDAVVSIMPPRARIRRHPQIEKKQKKKKKK